MRNYHILFFFTLHMFLFSACTEDTLENIDLQQDHRSQINPLDDCDGDGLPNDKDPDDDNDQIPDNEDACPCDPKNDCRLECTDHDPYILATALIRPRTCPGGGNCYPDPGQFLLEIQKEVLFKYAEINIYSQEGELIISSNEKFGGRVEYLNNTAEVFPVLINKHLSLEKAPVKILVVYQEGRYTRREVIECQL